MTIVIDYSRLSTSSEFPEHTFFFTYDWIKKRFEIDLKLKARRLIADINRYQPTTWKPPRHASPGKLQPYFKNILTISSI